ncbi:MAG: hypothetical protein DRJ61_11815 [Acidobacteria bacterium]|nr:MAG: hypothetical protein DRJ61_11815 [Acidobacteriota bacterium]
MTIDTRLHPAARAAANCALGILSFVILIVGSFPAVLWIGTYLSAVRASRYLGYWPTYGHPDPKDLPAEFWVQIWPYEYGLPIVTAMLLAGLPIVLILRKTRPFAWVPLAFGGMVLLLLLGIALMWLDPGGCLDWYMD